MPCGIYHTPASRLLSGWIAVQGLVDAGSIPTKIGQQTKIPAISAEIARRRLSFHSENCLPRSGKYVSHADGHRLSPVCDPGSFLTPNAPAAAAIVSEPTR